MLNRVARLSMLALLLPLLVLLGGRHPGIDAPETDAPATADPVAPVAASAPPIVIAISVDGLNPDAITRLGQAGSPHFHRMMREGAWTFNARAAVELTDTLPNHTSMMTGRPVSGGQGHHVTFNKDHPRSWLARVAGRYRASLFDVAHDRGIRTALYTSKTKFHFLNRSWNARHGAADRIGANDGRDKIDWYYCISPDAAMDKLIHQVVRAPARLTFWHNSVPDAAGHKHGYMSRGYLNAVRHADWMVGKLLNALDRRPALKQRVTVVLTSDHGGVGKNHSGFTKLANYRIPFFAWGPGVAAGRSLYSLNPERQDPRRSRPGYSGAQPIRNSDLANLATSLLDAPAVFTVHNRKTLKVR